MSKIYFKRSFWGYSPAGVENQIRQLNEDYKNSLMQLKKQLVDEVRSLELIEAEVRKAKKEVDVYYSMEAEISRLLLRAYLEAAERSFNVLRNADQAEKMAAERVIQKRDELTNTKATVKKVKKEISSMISNYMTVNVKAEGE